MVLDSEQSSERPTEETLLKMLDIQWQDHFQTRSQTWKALEILSILTVALVGLDWQIDNPLGTVVAAFLLLTLAFFGFQITLRHRQVEVTKFRIIASVEEQLGIADPKLGPPAPVHWWSIFLIWQSNTSLFLLRMQAIIILFAAGYLILRLFELLSA